MLLRFVTSKSAEPQLRNAHQNCGFVSSLIGSVFVVVLAVAASCGAASNLASDASRRLSELALVGVANIEYCYCYYGHQIQFHHCNDLRLLRTHATQTQASFRCKLESRAMLAVLKTTILKFGFILDYCFICRATNSAMQRSSRENL